MNLYIIISIIWQIFTILFFLYKFISPIYNFTKFLSSLTRSVLYLKNQFVIYRRKRNGYSIIDEEQTLTEPIKPKTYFQKLYDNTIKAARFSWQGTKNLFFGKDTLGVSREVYDNDNENNFSASSIDSFSNSNSDFNNFNMYNVKMSESSNLQCQQNSNDFSQLTEDDIFNQENSDPLFMSPSINF